MVVVLVEILFLTNVNRSYGYLIEDKLEAIVAGEVFVEVALVLVVVGS